jgi:hypothetical protein
MQRISTQVSLVPVKRVSSQLTMKVVRVISGFSPSTEAPPQAKERRWNWLNMGFGMGLGFVIAGIHFQKPIFALDFWDKKIRVPGDKLSEEGIHKEINFRPIKSDKFTGREDELKQLKELLSQEKKKIVLLEGEPGIGKTQIALKHNQETTRYNKRLFISCESKARFQESLETIAESFYTNIRGKSFDVVKHILKERKDYLLIIDNVDTGELASKVKVLLQGEIGGDVIITGRHKVLKDTYATIPVKEMTFQDGLDLFKAHLNPSFHADFDQIDEEEKRNFLVKSLRGSPLLIKIAAKSLVQLWRDSSKPRDLIHVRKQFTSMRSHAIHTVMMKILDDEDRMALEEADGIFFSSLESVRQTLQGKLYQALVNDVLYFYMFHFAQEIIPLPKPEHSVALQKLLIHASQRSSIYKGCNDGDIYDAFREITAKLEDHNLLASKEDNEHGWLVEISPLLRFSLLNRYLLDYEDREQKIKENGGLSEEVRKKELEELEKSKCAWLSGFVVYFNQISAGNELNAEQLSFLLGAIKLIKSFTDSLELRSSIVNSMHLWKEVKMAFQQETVGSIEAIKNIPLKELEILFEDLFQKKEDKKYEQETLKILINLGNTYMKSDPINAERLLEIAEKDGSALAIFHLGLLYYYEANKKSEGKEKRQLLQKAIDKNSLAFEKGHFPEALNNRAVCYPKDDPEGRKKAIPDLKEAVKLNCAHPKFRENLADYLRKDGQVKEAAVEQRVFEGLTFLKEEKKDKPISKEYMQLILDFLQADKVYKTEGDRFNHSMADKGVLFGKMIPYNEAIEELVIYGCNFDDRGFESIAKSLETNSSIKKLSLDCNNLVSASGIRALSDALAKNQYIEELSLHSSSSISSEDILYLLEKAPLQLKKIYCTLGGNKDAILKKASEKGISLLLK